MADLPPPKLATPPNCACRGLAPQMREHAVDHCSVLTTDEVNHLTDQLDAMAKPKPSTEPKPPTHFSQNLVRELITKYKVQVPDQPLAARCIDNNIALLLQDRDDLRKAITTAAGVIRQKGNNALADHLDGIVSGVVRLTAAPPQEIVTGADGAVCQPPVHIIQSQSASPSASEVVDTVQQHAANLEQLYIGRLHRLSVYLHDLRAHPLREGMRLFVVNLCRKRDFVDDLLDKNGV